MVWYGKRASYAVVKWGWLEEGEGEGEEEGEGEREEEGEGEMG